MPQASFNELRWWSLMGLLNEATRLLVTSAAMIEAKGPSMAKTIASAYGPCPSPFVGQSDRIKED